MYGITSLCGSKQCPFVIQVCDLNRKNLMVVMCSFKEGDGNAKVQSHFAGISGHHITSKLGSHLGPEKNIVRVGLFNVYYCCLCGDK